MDDETRRDEINRQLMPDSPDEVLGNNCVSVIAMGNALSGVAGVIGKADSDPAVDMQTEAAVFLPVLVRDIAASGATDDQEWPRVITLQISGHELMHFYDAVFRTVLHHLADYGQRLPDSELHRNNQQVDQFRATMPDHLPGWD